MSWLRRRAAFVVTAAAKRALPGRGLGAAWDDTAGLTWRGVIGLADEAYSATVMP